MSIPFADCQSFAGGFAMGATNAGLELVAKREHSGGFGVPAMEANRHLLGHNWKAQESDGRDWEAVDVPVVLGNPPCSFASTLSTKKFRGANSPIAYCWRDLVEFGARCDADIIVSESVQQAYNGVLPMMQGLHALLEEQTGNNYNVYHVLHDSYAFFGPAIRKRYFFVASRIPFGIERPDFVPEDQRITIGDVWGDLQAQPLAWEHQPYADEPTRWSKKLRAPSGMVDGHLPAKETPWMRRALDIIDEVEWNEGDDLSVASKRYRDATGNLPASWQGPLLEKALAKDLQLGFNTPMRWRWDRPGRVITGSSLFQIIHPRIPRFITHREALRMVGFPDAWQVQGLDSRKAAAYWGKGITCQAGEWISSWVKDAVEGHPGSYVGEQMGEREWVIDVTHDWKRTETERARNRPRVPDDAIPYLGTSDGQEDGRLVRS